MRILAIPSDATACAYYRILKPLEAMRDLGMAEVTFSVRNPKDGQQHLAWADYDDSINVSNFEIVVLNRNQDPAIIKFARDCRERGIKVVYDIDDDLFTLPANNPAYVAWGRDAQKVMAIQTRMLQQGVAKYKVTPEQMAVIARGNFDAIVANMRASDVVTVTTGALRNSYSKVVRDIEILPNQMHPPDWEDIEYPEHDGETWVGWAGSATHYDDLKPVAGAITDAIRREPEARLVICGFPLAARILFADLQAKGQVITYPWTDMQAYRSILAAMDIVLAPSAPMPFNEGKSDIRVLEAGMVGRPVVASETTYGYTVRQSGGGIVPRNAPEWTSAISRLLTDTDLRSQLGRANARYARTRSYTNYAGLWHAVYKRVLNGKSDNRRRI